MGQAENRKGFFPADPEARMNYYPIAASQTLAAGDAVILTSNLVDVALDSSAALLGVIARDCSGLAASTMVPVWDDPDTVFIGTANADSSGVGAGDEVDLVGTTGIMQIDEDASSTDVFKLIAALPDDAPATANCRWKFKINKHLLAQID